MATKKDLDDIIGEKKSLAKGAYLSRHRCSAIVYRVTATKVYAIYLGGTNGIETSACSLDKFLEDYPKMLINYPIRRAARVYMSSPMPKTEEALRELRVLLRS